MFLNRNHSRPSLAPRRGLILPLVMVTVAIALILGLAFLSSASTATQQSSAVDHRLRARMIAESGLATTLAYIERDHNAWRIDRADGVWLPSQSLHGGSFTITGNDGDQLDASGAVVGDGNLADDASDPVTITSVGVYRGARHLARAVRHVPKARGIVVNERVEVRKTGLIDSYDPKAGPYAAATATPAALARSNGLARQPYIRLRNNARVNGNVYFGPGGNIARALQADATAIVTGTTTPLPTWVTMTDVAEPAWTQDPVGVNRVHSSGINMLTTDQWYDNVTLSGTATLRAVGANVKLYVRDTLTVTDDARIEVGSATTYGATVKGAITVASSVPVDSYDSSLGAYGGTNVSSLAVLATNSTLPGAITVSSTVRGDVYTGVGSVPATSIIGGGTVTGTKGALTQPLAFPAPQPMPSDFPASVGNLQIKDTTYTLASDLQTGTLELTGQGILRVSGHRRIRVNGDFLFNGNSTIDIPADSSLKIYVAGTMIINGNGSGALANPGKSPPRLQLIGTGTGQTHHFSGNAEMHAIIDAPNATVHFEGNVSLYGAIIAGKLELTGNSALHNDRNAAMVDANPRLASGWTTGSKLTIYANKRIVLQSGAKVNAGAMNPQIVTINHLGYEPMDVGNSAAVFAEAVVPQAALNIAGDARWTGRIEARHLTVAGTAEVTADASGGTARPGIVVDETVELRDNAKLHGTGGAALLASHGTTDTTIWIKDTAAFKGDGYTAPAGNPSDEIRVAPGATYTGLKGALALPVPVAALTAPTPASASVGPKVYAGAASPPQILQGELVCDSFQVRDNAVVHVVGNARVIVAGDFKMCNNSQLILLPGATLTVYCGGQAFVYSTSQTNADGHPSRLVISCPNAAEIVVRGTTSRLSATILAPLAELRIIETAQVSGAFAGRRLWIDNSGKFHCAKDLPGPVTWLEQR